MKFCLLQTLLDNSLSDRILCTALDIFANLINIFQWTERRLNGPVFATSVSQSDNSSELNMEPMSLEFINSLWVPNIFIYNLKTYKVISVLSKLAGLWIDEKKKVLYRHGSLINLNSFFHNCVTATTINPSLYCLNTLTAVVFG